MAQIMRHELDIKTFKKLSEFIDTTLGIKMPETKKIMLESRLQKRLKALNLDSFEKYWNYLLSSDVRGGERTEFFNVVTTNKTDFYREISHFKYIEDVVLPEFTKRGKREMKVWSSACSSGEEPYTISFVLDQYRQKQSSFTFSVDATDISTKVLAIAKEAKYNGEQVEVIPKVVLSKYFKEEQGVRDKQYSIIPDIKRRVSFSQFNLMEKSYSQNKKYDIIFCRNVLIYFDRVRQEAIIKNLLTKLEPDGLLFLGHSESMAGMNLNLISVDSAVYKQKKGGM